VLVAVLDKRGFTQAPQLTTPRRGVHRTAHVSDARSGNGAERRENRVSGGGARSGRPWSLQWVSTKIGLSAERQAAAAHAPLTCSAMCVPLDSLIPNEFSSSNS